MPRLSALTLAALICALPAGPAWAEIERYALIIGNNLGQPDEVALRYAQDDARKVYQVLRNLGGFAPANMVMLAGEDAATVQQTLILMNERIRRATGPGRPGAMLLVYYSGHADSQALHLGSSSLPVRQLEALVEGSAADFRVLVLDACRSGVVTRTKGGRVGKPIDVRLEQRFAGEGMVFLAASAADEDAQESDQVKGSFFTHYLVSGLMGAADANRDGKVVLEEAYRYAYEHTLRASSRTLAGLQHPTFRYDLRGQGQVVLTTLTTAQRRAVVTVPPGRAYLFFRDSSNGPVVAEVGAFDQVRRISLPAGKYFVRGRAPRFLLEGQVLFASGDQRLSDDDLERSEYARLVRKGAAEVSAVAGLQAGLRARSGLFAAGPCAGIYAGFTWETRHFDLSPRVAICQSWDARLSTPEPALGGPTRGSEIALELVVAKAWDMSWATLDVGATAGLAALRDSAVVADSILGAGRRLTGLAGTALGVSRDFAGGFYARADIGLQVYLQNIRTTVQDPSGDYPRTVGEGLATDLAVRWGLGLGKRF